MSKSLSQNRLVILISAALVALVLIAYEPVRHSAFVTYDDDVYLIDNPHIQSGLTFASVKWAFTTGYFANWHPLTWLSYLLDAELFGLHPFGVHLHNVVLHIGGALLLFWVLRSMTGALWPSAFVAMLFGLHPLHVESVAWVSERKDVLCGLFWMLTMASYVGYVRRGGLFRYLLVALCFVLGLMAKPMIVTLPFVLLLLDFWPLGRFRKSPDLSSADGMLHPACRQPTSRLILEKIPLLILALASCIVTYLVQRHWGTMEKIEAIPLADRIANAAVSYTGYLVKLVYPANLAVLYPHPGDALPLWQPILAAATLLLITGIAWSLACKKPWLPAGWLWYVGTLVPVIGLVQVGSQAMADRYTYLPSIGIFIPAAWTAADLLGRRKGYKIVLSIAGCLVVILMLMGTRRQAAVWKNSYTLYEHTLQVTKDNYEIRANYADLFQKSGQLDAAAEHFRKALQIKPDYTGALNNLGVIYAQQDRLDDALGCFQAALQAHPDSFDAHNNMATVLITLGDYAGALEHIDKALDVRPDYAQAYYNLGRVRQEQGDLEASLRAYEQAVALGLNDYRVFHKAAVLKARLGFLKEAEGYIRTSIQFNPDYAETHRVLGLIFEKQDRIEEAIEQYRIALRLEPVDYVIHQALGHCLYIQGHLPEAKSCFERALRLAEAAGQTQAAAEIARMLRTLPDQTDESEPSIENHGDHSVPAP